ncbi:MAG: hypothetical protein ACLSAH_11105 [Bilophila wadsworthia]
MKPYLKDFMGDGLLIPAAAAIKQAVNIPVIAVGRLDEAKAEKILEEGKADLVAFGRVLWADPEFPARSRKAALRISCAARAAEPAKIRRWAAAPLRSTRHGPGKPFRHPARRKKRRFGHRRQPAGMGRPASPPCAGMT